MAASKFCLRYFLQYQWWHLKSETYYNLILPQVTQRFRLWILDDRKGTWQNILMQYVNFLVCIDDLRTIQSQLKVSNNLWTHSSPDTRQCPKKILTCKYQIQGTSFDDGTVLCNSADFICKNKVRHPSFMVRKIWTWAGKFTVQLNGKWRKGRYVCETR